MPLDGNISDIGVREKSKCPAKFREIQAGNAQPEGVH
jgi:hypothetical protein